MGRKHKNYKQAMQAQGMFNSPIVNQYIQAALMKHGSLPEDHKITNRLDADTVKAMGDLQKQNPDFFNRVRTDAQIYAAQRSAANSSPHEAPQSGAHHHEPAVAERQPGNAEAAEQPREVDPQIAKLRKNKVYTEYIQNRLKEAGANIKVDGKFGPKTEEAYNVLSEQQRDTYDRDAKLAMSKKSEISIPTEQASSTGVRMPDNKQAADKGFLNINTSKNNEGGDRTASFKAAYARHRKGDRPDLFVGRNTKTKMKWDDFAKKVAEESDPAKKVKMVNDAVNETMKYRDLKGDFAWTSTPSAQVTNGNQQVVCRDLATTKAFLLADSGYDMNKVSIVGLGGGEGHVVTAVNDGQGHRYLMEIDHKGGQHGTVIDVNNPTADHWGTTKRPVTYNIAGNNISGQAPAVNRVASNRSFFGMALN